MEFQFPLSFLKGNSHGITVCDGKFQRQLGHEELAQYSQVLNQMGKASCIAQGLGQPVTSSHLLPGTDHKVLILHDGNHRVQALLKIGTKKLFIHNLSHQYVQMKPLCVLDFYVHESCQRKGLGRFLFQWMLRFEGTEPRQIAYDAPSPKLLGFLRKHYGLKSFLPQNCKFVVYDDHFVRSDEYHYDPMDLNQPAPSKHTQPAAAADDVVPEEPVKYQKIQDIEPLIESTSIMEMKQHIDGKQDEAEQRCHVDAVQEPPASQSSGSAQILPGGLGQNVHEKQLSWIAQQIENTKKEIAESETRIYQHHLQNKVSPYAVDRVRDQKSLAIKRFKEMHRTKF